MNVFAVDLLAKLTVLVVFGLTLKALMRNMPASLRYGVLLATLGASVALPVLMSVSPAWEIRVLPANSASDTGNATATPRSERANEQERTTVGRISTTQSIIGPPVRSSVARDTARVPSQASLFLIWLLGTIAVAGWLASGHLRLRKIALNSVKLDATEWTTVFDTEKRKAEVDRPVVLLCSPDVNTPITWGVFQPMVVLPEEAVGWTEEHRRVVLAHELAHVARKDARSQLFAGVVCAMYWFHPLVWLVERKLRAECERACDDRVVASGTPGSVYAAHLLEVARSARSFGGPGFLSVAMARTSQLEGRLLAVLNDSNRRDSLSRWQKGTITAVAMILVSVLSAFLPIARENPAVAPAIIEASAPSISPPSMPVPSIAEPRAAEPGVKPATVPAVLPDSIFSESVNAQPGGTLLLDFPTTGATITVSGWDESRVQVLGTLGGKNWRSTETTLQTVAEGVRLRTVYTGGSGQTSFSNSFDIRVPRRYSVRLKSAGGGITILGLTGIFNGNTGGGEIEIRNTRGEIDLHTGGGEVHVTNSALNGNISTGGGAVRIEGNDGDLQGDSGTGDVINSTTTNSRGGTVTTNRGSRTTTGAITSIVGDAPESAASFGRNGTQIRRSGGSVNLDDAPNGARLITGGGPIRIGRSAGEVYASTGGGNIEIGPARGSVIASTGAGDVTVVFSGGGLHAADITSGLGQVILVLPDNFSGTLELESAYTNNFSRKTAIHSDWPLEATETTDWDASVGTPRRYVRGRKAFGNGAGIIRVRTVNGDVIVRRGSDTR